MSMSTKNAPAPDIMNVRQIIEYAFGDFEKNTVNFKLVQTVLFLIARQLRLLERRVEIQFGPLHDQMLPSESTLSVTEVKIHAMQKKKPTGKKKIKGGGVAGAKTGGAILGVGKAKEKKTGGDLSSSDKYSTDKTSTDKSSTDKTSTDKTSADKTSTDKTSSTDKTTSTDMTYSGKITSSGDKTSTDITTSTFITSSGKTPSSGEKTSTDMTTSTLITSSGKTPLSGEKASTDMTISTGKTPSSGEKTSTDIITSTFITTSEKTPLAGEKASTDMTISTVMTSSGKTPSSGEKTSTDMTTSTVITSSGKTPSPGEKTSTDMTTSTFITSSGKTTSSGEKASADKTTSTDKSSSWKTTSSERKPTDKTSSSRRTPFSKEVDQGQKRADSLEEGKKTPTPMASVTSMPEAQYEKLLVVKKVPSKEARAGESVHGHKRTPRISVVTQEQFEEVADVVRDLQKKLLPVGTPGFPEHAELMEALRRGASLTDAMSALQLSARLEATEKALGQMMSMVTELALATPGVELDLDTRTYLGLEGETEQKGFNAIAEFGPGKRGKVRQVKGGKGMAAPLAFQPPGITTSETVGGTETETHSPGKATAVASQSADQSRLAQYVTYLDLQNAAAEIYQELIKKAKTLTSRTSTTAENAYKLAVKLEAKLNSSVNVSSQMANLENAVKQYAEQINLLDTGLSSQMTNYQEQLTQMQHDLEIGLDNMAEVFGNAGGDVEAISELHSHFAGLQVDLENMAFRQKQLKDSQDSTSYDLENLWKEIEMLRDSKSDREEVADALRDKAGISQLNGLVSLQQFAAVRGDFEKSIAAAYDTFNNQEYVWQKAIDDMLKILYEKADVVQVQCLSDEIQKNLNILKDRIKIIADIVGEPRSAILSKKVFRDSSCLACGSPAFMDMEEPVKIPALPKFPSVKHPSEASEAESQTKGGGDNRPCYPDLPIPHPVDPRAHICKRYCGGSHTVITDGLNRPPQSLVVQQAQRPSNTAPGTDGKLYMVDEESTKIPCLPCNISKPTPVTPDPEPLTVQTHSTEEIRYLSMTPPARDISYKSYN